MEILAAINTTPHTVGWSTGSILDQQHRIRDNAGVESYLCLVPPSQRPQDNAFAALALPHRVDLRKEHRTDDILIHSLIAGTNWEDVVTLLPARPTGDVVENSFAHTILREHSHYACSDDNPDKKFWEPACVDWSNCSKFVEDTYRPGKKPRTFIGGVPKAAIKFAEGWYRDASSAIKDKGIRVGEFQLVCAPAIDSVVGAEQSAWTCFACTQHKTDTSNGSIIEGVKKKHQSLCLVFKLTGFW